MELQINRNEPFIMHLDLNSCFATCMQQAFPRLRGKPIAIVAYPGPGACILAPSIEAKKFGVKTGMQFRAGKLLCRDLIARDPDPVMVRDVHIKLKRVCKDYSPDVFPKSIDELVLDFTHMAHLKLNLIEIAKDIKGRIRKDIGEWMSCNIGISTNRFLAKLAASLHKPDGLDLITAKNLKEVYSKIVLTDLNGINTKFQARLNANGIFSPLEFLNADLRLLKSHVFKSITGWYWYLRLRGFEIDDVEFERKSYGQDYALKQPTADKKELSRMIMNQCDKISMRLRNARQATLGIHLGFIYSDWTSWHMGRKVHTEMYTTQELFTKAMWLFNQQPNKKHVSHLQTSCYNPTEYNKSQLELFDTPEQKLRNVYEAVSEMNDRYGIQVVKPASVMGMEKIMLDRISFGAIKELEDLYSN